MRGILLAALLLPSGAQGASPRLSKERIILRTSMGDLVLALFPDVAPRHTEQILKLARLGIYDATHFHRVHRGFVVQLAGHHERLDLPRNRTLELTPAQKAAIHKIPAEFSSIPHIRGVLSMARADSDPDSAESSFSLLLGNAPHLDRKYTIFGIVAAGWDVLTAIESVAVDANKRPRRPVQVLRVEVVDEEDLKSMNLRQAIPQPAGTDQPAPPLFILVGGVLLITGIQAAWFAGRPPARRARTVALIIALVGFFILFIVSVPQAIRRPSGWIGIAVLAGSIAMFRLMATFEGLPPGAKK